MQNNVNGDQNASSEAALVAKAAAISHLRNEHAYAGFVEGGYCIDRLTGEILQFATGTENSVDFDEQIIASRPHVLTLHSHPEDGAAGPHDWQAFIEQHTNRESVIVTPNKNFTL